MSARPVPGLASESMPWFEAIDAQAPWLAPYRPQLPAALNGLRRGQPVAQVLNALAQAQLDAGACAPDVRFVPQAELPAGQAYEQFIWQQRRVPTRDNAHDFFNGLAWLVFPRTKARLNELQAAEIVASGVGAIRGPLRDALTLFDENAALMLAPPELVHALRARQWQRLFVDLRPRWAQAQVCVFGHAAQEKLLQPRKAITAHVYLPGAPLAAGEGLDASLAADLDPVRLAEKPYAPLPILGIPLWWPENERPGFYADASVFRAPRGSLELGGGAPI